MLVRRASACLILVVAIVLAAGCGGARSRLMTHMRSGQAYFDAGNFTKASIEFRNALQISPKDVSARLMAGRAAEKLGRIRAAAGLYQSVIDDQPNNLDARIDLGRLMIVGGAVDKGLKIIEPALASHPDDPRLLILRATARLRQKDSAGALADTERALKLDPSYRDAITLRAGLYQNAGEFQPAAALIQAALKADPRATDMHEILTDIYVAAGDLKGAEQQLQTLIGLKPEDLRYRTKLSVLYARTDRIDDAQRVLEAAVQELPHSVDAKRKLVIFIAAERGRVQAESLLREYVRRDPDNMDLYLALADLQERSGEYGAASDTYHDLVRRGGTSPNGLTARDRLAVMAVRQSQYDDALKLIREVLDKNPLDSDALTLRGEIFLQRGDPAAAIGDLRAVLRDAPTTVPLETLLARAYLANDEPTLAEEALRTAMNIDLKDASVRTQLAVVLLKLERPEQAIALLNETVQLAPQDPGARETLARALLANRDFAAARAAAGSFETLRPDSPIGPFIAGRAAEGEGKADDAQAEFERALAVQPNDFEALKALSRLDVARGRGNQAIVLVKAAVDRAPKDPALVNLLGEIYLTQKNLAAASEAFQTAVALVPTWPLPYHNLALTKLAAGDGVSAIATYQTGIKAAPSDPDLVIELARLYQGERRTDDAIKLYATWNERYPRVTSVANNLALLLVTNRSDRASLDRAQALVAEFAMSTDGRLLDTSGWVRFKRAEYTDAVRVLQQAAQRLPDSREIRYHLGMAELQAGSSSRARRDLEAALSGSTHDAWANDARTALASLKSSTG